MGGYGKPRKCIICKTFIGYMRGHGTRCKKCRRIR